MRHPHRWGARRPTGAGAAALLLAAALTVLVGGTGTAYAHGDPSSHWLEHDVLYPAVADRPEPDTELALLGLLFAAGEAGYPLRVSLVASEDDLTEDATMLTRPQAYAEFVAGELGAVSPLSAPVLVVTAAGYGLAGPVTDATGRAADEADRSRLVAALPSPRAGGQALAVAALGATRLLASAAGHPLPAVVPPARPLRVPEQVAASPGPPWVLPLGVFLGVMLTAVLGRRLLEAGRRRVA